MFDWFFRWLWDLCRGVLYLIDWIEQAFMYLAGAKARLTTAEQEHADAEPPEDGSEKTKYSQLRTDFFVIEVFGPPCRIDTLIFRVGGE